jgi:hypothetical protein
MSNRFVIYLKPKQGPAGPPGDTISRENLAAVLKDVLVIDSDGEHVFDSDGDVVFGGATE